MTIVLSTPPYQQFYDSNGDPLSGGLVYTYLAGTLTPQATYTNQGGATPCANPIVLDSAGRAEFWLDNANSYKYIVKDSLGNTIRTIDNVAPFSTASGLSVLGTIPSNTIVGNNTGATATPTALTSAEVGALIGITNGANDFRLSLTTAVPVTTSDVTGATTIYCVPYKGNRIALYDGSTGWNTRTSAQFSLALGTLTASIPYDVFCYDNAGVPTLEFVGWSTETARSTALVYQDGILVRSGATTRRYLGTFYTTSTTQTEDSYAKRFLWNYYNRVERPMKALEATASWNYTTATWRQARASTANQLDFVIGVSEDAVIATVNANVSNNNGGGTCAAAISIGLDSTTAPSASAVIGGHGAANITAGNGLPVIASYRQFPGIGRHYLAWLEISEAAGTTTWFGANTSTFATAGGIIGSING